MTTIVNGVSISSIGSAAGRDFSTITAWFDSIPTDVVASGLSYVGELYNDSEFLLTSQLTLGSRTTSATKNITLRAASGHSFRDNANVETTGMAYSVSKGVGIRTAENYTNHVVITCDNFLLTGLQIANTGGGNSQNALYVSGSGSVVDACLVTSGAPNGSGGGWYASTMSVGKGVIVRNTMVVDTTSNTSGAAFAVDYADPYIENCTIVVPSDRSRANPIVRGSGNPTFVNCAVFAEGTLTGCFSNIPELNTMTISGSNNASSRPVTFGTNKYNSLVYADQFVNPSLAALDFRTKGTSTLRNAGTATTSELSYSGSVRQQAGTTDIGAWEFSEPAVVPTAPVIGTAVGDENSAFVAFSKPASNGGAVITSYTATSIPGGISASSPTSPIYVPGLTAGTSYTFTVKATNSAGTGPASASSNAVVPVIPDVTPPTLLSAVVSSTIGYNVVRLTFSEAIKTGSTLTGYAVSGHRVDSVTIVGNDPTSIDLKLGEAFKYGETQRTVTYTKPASANATKDARNNEVSNFSTNIANTLPAVTDITVPTITNVTASNKILGSNIPVVLVTFSENVIGDPLATDYTISNHATTGTLYPIAGRNDQRAVGVVGEFQVGEVITFSYTQPTTGYLTDGVGNKLASVTSMAVDNFVGQDIQSAKTSEDSGMIILTMNGSLNTNFTPDASAFTVSGGKTVLGVRLQGSQVFLSLSSTYGPSDTITVGYTKPASNYLRYSDEVVPASFTNKQVVNGFKVGSWSALGNEGATVTVPANSLVRFGGEGKYVERYASGSIQLSISFFGTDPLPGGGKQGQIYNIAGPATGITMSGPLYGPIGSSSPDFTLALNGVVETNQTITLSGDGLSFTPNQITFTPYINTATFKVTAQAAGQYTIKANYAGSLTKPADLIYNAATSIVKTIGAGKDFANLSAFANYVRNMDIPASGTGITGLLYESQVGSWDMRCGNSSPDFYCELKPAPGLGVNELLPNSPFDYGNVGIELLLDGNDTIVFAGWKLNGLRIKLNPTSGRIGGGTYGWGAGGSFDARFENCRILSQRTNITFGLGNYAVATAFRNCLFIQETNYVKFIDGEGYATWNQCTFVRRNGSGTGKFTNNGMRMENCAFIGMGGDISASNEGWAYSKKNVADTAFVANNTTGFTFGSNLVVNALSDYTPKAGGGLVGTGSAIFYSTKDIVGANRGFAPDVGAWQSVRATPLAEGEIVLQVLDGQSLGLSGKMKNAVTAANAYLVPKGGVADNDAVAMGPIPVTFDTIAGTFSVVIDDVAPGTYAIPYVEFENVGGRNRSTGGQSFSIIGVDSVSSDPVNSGPATAVLMNGPKSGAPGVTSTPFTVLLDGTSTGTVTVTPSDNGAGGTFAPTSVSIVNGVSASFTYTRATSGNTSITLTVTGGLTAPAAFVHSVIALPTLSITTAATNRITGRTVNLSGPVNLQGDTGGMVEVYFDSIPAGTTQGPFLATINSGTWTLTQKVNLNLFAIRVVVTAYGQTTTTTTPGITVLRLYGSAKL